MSKRISNLDLSTQLNEKNIVVLDIGRQYTKCGLAGEPSPRAIIKSAVRQSDDEYLYLHDIEDEELLKSSLGNFIELVYFNHLAVTPKDKKVVIVESVFCKSTFRNILTRVLFDQFNIPSLMFVPNHLMTLATLGVTTGLVLDMGSDETISIAVVEGVTLLNCAQICNLAARSLDNFIRSVLITNNPHLDVMLKPDVIEDIRIKLCFVAPYSRALQMTQSKSSGSEKSIQDKEKMEVASDEICLMEGMRLCSPDEMTAPSIQYCLGGNSMITMPGNLREGACEMLFEIYGHEHSLVTMIIETILMAPIDCRKLLCENIVIVGGLANLPGLERRLAEELLNIGSKFSNQTTKPPNSFKFHKPICPKNYVSWLGASMFCSTKFFEMRSTSRTDWINGGKKNLSEWSDLVWRDKYVIQKAISNN